MRACTWIVCCCLSTALGARAGADGHGPATTSPVATLLKVEFDAELTSTSKSNLQGQARAQLLYTIGHFNAEPGVARLDQLVLSNLVAEPQPGGRYRIRYHASLPVAWGHKTGLPTLYNLMLPKRIDLLGQEEFTKRYAPSCKDDNDHVVSVHNFWFHYRPHAQGCAIVPDDVVACTAKVSVSTENNTVTYPEYHRVWEDNALEVVAIFSKFSPGATSNDDGIAGFDAFVAAAQKELPGATITPAKLAGPPGAAHPDVTLQRVNPDGSMVSVVALLVDDPRKTPAWFDRRYAELTPGADVVIYNGHAGLGKNIKAISEKGQFFPGKYQIFFLNGCDTFAYGDAPLVARRDKLNPDDPDGSKYMDLLANAMPAFFDSLPGASMALIRALLQRSRPMSYGELLRPIDQRQVVMVTGSEDNEFTPARSVAKWDGFQLVGAVKRGQRADMATAVLPPGAYVFTMVPDAAFSGGDAELRLRAGSPPPSSPVFKCPSYGATSNARCTVTLDAPTPIHLSVTGVGPESRFIVRGFKR